MLDKSLIPQLAVIFTGFLGRDALGQPDYLLPISYFLCFILLCLHHQHPLGNINNYY